MNCRVIVLGCGSEAEVPEKGCECEQCRETRASKWPRSSPAVMLVHNDTRLLLDAGPDIGKQLERKGIFNPHYCWISHAHPDHIDGIDDLPASTRVFIKEPFEFDHCRVEVFPVTHSTIRPATGCVFYSDHLKIAYVPDFLEISPEGKELIKGANLAILDGSSILRDIRRGTEEEPIGHQSMANSLRMAKDLGIKRVLFLHFGHIKVGRDTLREILSSNVPDAPEFFLSQDGFEIDILDGIRQEQEGKTFKSILSGLYLLPPHGELIAKREKTLIIKSVKFTENLLVPVYVVSKEEDDPRGQASVWAKIVLSEPEAIDLEQFEKLRDQHRITDEERETWWKGIKKFYAYKFQFLEGYIPPYKCILEPGVQVWIKNVTFIGEKPKELALENTFDVPGYHQDGTLSWDVGHAEYITLSYSDIETINYDIENKYERWPELIADHRYIQIWYARGRKTIRTDGGEEDIVKVHARVVDALRSMYFPMEPAERGKNAELDRLSRKFEKTSPPETEEERREWDRKRRELFEKGKLKAREVVIPEDKLKVIYPGYLLNLTDEEIEELHHDLHTTYQAPRINKELVVNAHIFVVGALRGRGREHPWIGDELDRETRRITGDRVRLLGPRVQEWNPSLVQETLVPLVNIHEALSLVGSWVYGLVEAPHDADFLIRHPLFVEEAWRNLQKLLPDVSVHITPEEKGPNWDYVPLGDFIVVPKGWEIEDFEPEIEPEGLTSDCQQLLRSVRPFMLKENYLLFDPQGREIIIRDSLL